MERRNVARKVKESSSTSQLSNRRLRTGLAATCERRRSLPCLSHPHAVGFKLKLEIVRAVAKLRCLLGNELVRVPVPFANWFDEPFERCVGGIYAIVAFLKPSNCAIPILVCVESGICKE